MRGVTEEEAKKLLAEFGENRFVREKEINIFEIITEQFQLQMIILLIAIGFFSFVNFPIAVTALLFLAAMIFLESYRDIQIRKAISAIQTAYSGETIVVREGMKKIIPVRLVVPGDIVVLKKGMRIPADGFVIDGECEVDEKVFDRGILKKKKIEEKERGEIIAFKKEDPSLLLAGTFVVSGECLMKVEKTGLATQFAKRLYAVEPEEKKEIITKIEKITDAINPFVLLIGVIIFLVEIYYGIPYLDAFAIAAAAAVAGVPQYIFSTVITAFFLTLERMSRFVAIRREDIIEKLSNVTVICTEKAKVLSMGEYTVRRIWMDKTDVEVTGDGWDTFGEFKGVKNFSTLDFLSKIVISATEAYPIYEENKEKRGRIKFSGNQIESALVVLGMKNKQPVEIIRGEYILKSKKYDEKSDLTFSTIKTPKDTKLMCIFGDANAVLQKCEKIYSNGKFEKLSKPVRSEVEHKIIEIAADGFQPIAVGWVEKTKKEKVEKYTLLALLGIYDPPKAEIKNIVEECKAAGIKIIVLTEESETTAIQFARQLGILEKGKRSIITEELKYMSPSERKKIIQQTVVFAHATPEEEKLVIEELKSLGEKVAFIESVGDDPQAMKAANVSIVLESSQDILKFNSDCILLKDDFYGASKAIEEAKTFLFNAERLFYSLLTSDFSILFFVLLSVSLYDGKTISLLQILLINAFADGVLGVGLVRERIPHTALTPIQQIKKIKFPDKNEFTFSFGLSIYIALVTYLIATSAATTNATNFASTALLVLLLSFTAISISYITVREPILKKSNLSNLSNLLENLKKYSQRKIWSGVAIMLILFLVVVYTPLNKIFEINPPTLGQWISAFLVALSIFIFTEIKKSIQSSYLKSYSTS